MASQTEVDLECPECDRVIASIKMKMLVFDWISDLS